MLIICLKRYCIPFLFLFLPQVGVAAEGHIDLIYKKFTAAGSSTHVVAESAGNRLFQSIRSEMASSEFSRVRLKTAVGSGSFSGKKGDIVLEGRVNGKRIIAPSSSREVYYYRLEVVLKEYQSGAVRQRFTSEWGDVRQLGQSCDFIARQIVGTVTNYSIHHEELPKVQGFKMDGPYTRYFIYAAAGSGCGLGEFSSAAGYSLSLRIGGGIESFWPSLLNSYNIVVSTDFGYDRCFPQKKNMESLTVLSMSPGIGYLFRFTSATITLITGPLIQLAMLNFDKNGINDKGDYSYSMGYYVQPGCRFSLDAGYFLTENIRGFIRPEYSVFADSLRAMHYITVSLGAAYVY